MPVCCQLPNLRESHNFQDARSNCPPVGHSIFDSSSIEPRGWLLWLPVMITGPSSKILQLLTVGDNRRLIQICIWKIVGIRGTKAKVSEDCKDQTTEFKILWSLSHLEMKMLAYSYTHKLPSSSLSTQHMGLPSPSVTPPPSRYAGCKP